MTDRSFSEQIDEIIKDHDSWKGEVLAQIRAVIRAADPDLTETVKWKTPSRPRGLPVWEHDGMFCFAEIWKDNVKLIFTKGAYLKNSSRLFNSRLESTDIRAIEFRENEKINGLDLTSIVHEAVEFNKSKKK